MNQTVIWKALLDDLCSSFKSFAAEFETIYGDHGRKPAIEDLAAQVFMSRSTFYERVKHGDWHSVDDIVRLGKALTCTDEERTHLINAFVCQKLNALLTGLPSDD